MKKVILCIAFFLSIVVTKGQEKRINLYGGYVFDDEFESYVDYYNYINGKIKAGFQYGAGLEFMVKPDYGVELLWQSQSTEAPVRYYSTGFISEKATVVDLSLNYAMLAGTRYAQNSSGKFEGYGSFMLGALFLGA